jgi:serine/threonine-protein kinase HipA
MREILRILETGERPADDMRAFLKAQVVYWMLAAVDGHAKNFSLFHERGGAYRLTPFYDVLSAWPIIGRGKGKIPPQKVKMAMAVEGKNRHYLWDSIHARHWIETARRCGIADMEAIIADIVSRTPAVIDRVQAAISKGFPAAIAESILDGVRASSERLRREWKS